VRLAPPYLREHGLDELLATAKEAEEIARSNARLVLYPHLP
jgi:hypothetical protein